MLNRYVSDKTHHGLSIDPETGKTINFCHDAYNDYVEYKLDKIANELNIPLQYNSKKTQDIINELQKRKDSMSVAELTLLRDKVNGLEEFLRLKNQQGIDLYLKNQNNQKIKNYYSYFAY